MSYTKFVIVGQERTGSILLQMLLASHSNVLSFGEVFNPTEETRKLSIKIARHLELEDDPIEFLENYVYKEYPNIKAVGFRLFYTHARDYEWETVWEYLRHSNINVIHLKRRNHLDRYLSHQLALRSNKWIAYQGEKSSAKKPIALDPEECLRDFNRSVWFQKEADDFFKDNPVIEVIYEDLCDDLAGGSKRIQAFLGLEFQALSPKTKKQQTRKKSEIIENYDELRNQFIVYVSKGWAKKEWLDFFDDIDDTSLVTQEIRYRMAKAGEVLLGWGINGWQMVPEEMRPAGTILKDGVMHTPMDRQNDTFIAKVQVPAGTKLNYGFLITKTGSGADIEAIWHRHPEDLVITSQNDVAKVEAPSKVVKQMDTGIRHYRKQKSYEFE